ncbi:MAG TPA: DUF3616 domain-containing protein, partial [Luteitalea sp.]|nr:DUF3616 domain-containing protein [Luteitalea sp.]
PTMDLDGRVLLYRWKGGARVKKETVVERSRLKVALDFPLDDRRRPDHDHPEGLCALPSSGDTPAGWLVVYDAPDPARMPNKRTVIADLFPTR